MDHSDTDMFDTYECMDMIGVTNGKLVSSTLRGKKKNQVMEDGKCVTKIFKDFIHVPELGINLFSLTYMMKKMHDYSKKWNVLHA